MNLAHCNKSWLNVKYKRSHVVCELKNPHPHPPYLKNSFGKNYVGTLCKSIVRILKTIVRCVKSAYTVLLKKSYICFYKGRLRIYQEVIENHVENTIKEKNFLVFFFYPVTLLNWGPFLRIHCKFENRLWVESLGISYLNDQGDGA